jgi:hypothetical protein
MNRRGLLFALAAVVAPSPVLAQGAETPEALVRALYVAHEPAIRGDGQGVLDTPALRRRFLTPAFAAAVARSQQRSEAAGEILDDTLDFDPITASQDPVVRDLRVRQLSMQGDRATVEVSFDQGETRRVTLHYVLARVDAGWRVFDIQRPREGTEEGWSVRRILRMRT